MLAVVNFISLTILVFLMGLWLVGNMKMALLALILLWIREMARLGPLKFWVNTRWKFDNQPLTVELMA